jgi:hypothetical protein
VWRALPATEHLELGLLWLRKAQMHIQIVGDVAQKGPDAFTNR